LVNRADEVSSGVLNPDEIGATFAGTSAPATTGEALERSHQIQNWLDVVNKF